MTLKEIEQRGQGDVKKGLLSSVFGDVFKLSSGGKVVLDYACDKCGTRFFICRHCMCPNQHVIGIEVCGSCNGDLVT